MFNFKIIKIMCWMSTRKDGKAIPKVAEKDIPIIKIGESFKKDKFLSSIQGYIYDLQCTTPKVKIIPYDTKINYISEGYHFYKPNMITILKYSELAVDICNIFNKKTVYRIITNRYTTHNRIAKGYIPKGTVYYLNADGEGVAEQIVLTEIIKINKCLIN